MAGYDPLPEAPKKSTGVSLRAGDKPIPFLGPQPEEIEGLLDQIEEKYFRSAEAKRLSELPPNECPCTIKHPTDWKEVDDMLKDFKLGDGKDFLESLNVQWDPRKVSPVQETEDHRKKCFNLYLSGSFESMGCCTFGDEKACDAIKCLRCDFSVLHFDNFAWNASTDYLFLRNNFPDIEKLSSKLYKKKGARAYACQCQHITATGLINMLSRPAVRWVCGKHYFAPSGIK